MFRKRTKPAQPLTQDQYLDQLKKVINPIAIENPGLSGRVYVLIKLIDYLIGSKFIQSPCADDAEVYQLTKIAELLIGKSANSQDKKLLQQKKLPFSFPQVPTDAVQRAEFIDSGIFYMMQQLQIWENPLYQQVGEDINELLRALSVPIANVPEESKINFLQYFGGLIKGTSTDVNSVLQASTTDPLMQTRGLAIGKWRALRAQIDLIGSSLCDLPQGENRTKFQQRLQRLEARLADYLEYLNTPCANAQKIIEGLVAEGDGLITDQIKSAKQLLDDIGYAQSTNEQLLEKLKTINMQISDLLAKGQLGECFATLQQSQPALHNFIVYVQTSVNEFLEKADAVSDRHKIIAILEQAKSLCEALTQVVCLPAEENVADLLTQSLFPVLHITAACRIEHLKQIFQQMQLVESEDGNFNCLRLMLGVYIENAKRWLAHHPAIKDLTDVHLQQGLAILQAEDRCTEFLRQNHLDQVLLHLQRNNIEITSSDMSMRSIQDAGGFKHALLELQTRFRGVIEGIKAGMRQQYSCAMEKKHSEEGEGGVNLQERGVEAIISEIDELFNPFFAGLESSTEYSDIYALLTPISEGLNAKNQLTEPLKYMFGILGQYRSIKDSRAAAITHIQNLRRDILAWSSGLQMRKGKCETPEVQAFIDEFLGLIPDAGEDFTYKALEICFQSAHTFLSNKQREIMKWAQLHQLCSMRGAKLRQDEELVEGQIRNIKQRIEELRTENSALSGKLMGMMDSRNLSSTLGWALPSGEVGDCGQDINFIADMQRLEALQANDDPAIQAHVAIIASKLEQMAAFTQQYQALQTPLMYHLSPTGWQIITEFLSAMRAEIDRSFAEIDEILAARDGQLQEMAGLRTSIQDLAGRTSVALEHQDLLTGLEIDTQDERQELEALSQEIAGLRDIGSIDAAEGSTCEAVAAAHGDFLARHNRLLIINASVDTWHARVSDLAERSDIRKELIETNRAIAQLQQEIAAIDPHVKGDDSAAWLESDADIMKHLKEDDIKNLRTHLATGQQLIVQMQILHNKLQLRSRLRALQEQMEPICARIRVWNPASGQSEVQSLLERKEKCDVYVAGDVSELELRMVEEAAVLLQELQVQEQQMREALETQIAEQRKLEAALTQQLRDCSADLDQQNEEKKVLMKRYEDTVWGELQGEISKLKPKPSSGFLGGAASRLRAMVGQQPPFDALLAKIPHQQPPTGELTNVLQEIVAAVPQDPSKEDQNLNLLIAAIENAHTMAVEIENDSDIRRCSAEIERLSGLVITSLPEQLQSAREEAEKLGNLLACNVSVERPPETHALTEAPQAMYSQPQRGRGRGTNGNGRGGRARLVHIAPGDDGTGSADTHMPPPPGSY